MTTALVILAIWTLLSVPMSVFLGRCLDAVDPPELLGIDGSFAVYRSADGMLHRVPLLESAAT